MEEIMFTLTELVRQGKIRYFGSSMFPADRIVESHWIAEKRGLLRFRCEQPWYSIFSRDIERFVLPTCDRYGMGVITWSPLDGGFLTGKYKSKKDLTVESRVGQFATRILGSFDPEAEIYQKKIKLVEKLKSVADTAGLSLTHMAVAFSLEEGAAVTASRRRCLPAHRPKHVERVDRHGKSAPPASRKNACLGKDIRDKTRQPRPQYPQTGQATQAKQHGGGSPAKDAGAQQPQPHPGQSPG